MSDKIDELKRELFELLCECKIPELSYNEIILFQILAEDE